MHSTHFIYGYTVSDICKRPLSKRKNPLLPLHRLLFLISSKGPFIIIITWTRQYTPYHFYTTHAAVAGMGNSSVGPPCGIDLMTHCTMNRHSTTKIHLSPFTCRFCVSCSRLLITWLLPF